MYDKAYKNKVGINMRINNLVKYIFIAFAIGIIIYAGYRIYKNNNTEKNEVEVV